jgi:single-stranded DNA-binding protein
MAIQYSKEKDGTLNVLVTGRLPRDPELRETAKGNKLRFSVAYGKSKYMNCEAWADSGAGRMAGYLEKGDHVLVTGTHRSHEYNCKTYENVEADFITTMGSPAPTAASTTPSVEQAQATQPGNEFEEVDDEELPF